MLNKQPSFIALALATLVIAAQGAFAQLDASPKPQAKLQVEGKYFDSNGVRLHYTEQGKLDGPPVILIHGFAVNQDINWRWPGFMRLLEDRYRVIGLDVRGHGLSDKPHGADHYGAELINDVARLMDHLGIEKTHLAGYSMGGFITMACLGAFPERIVSAVVGGAGYFPRDEYPDLIARVPEALRSGQGMKPLNDFFDGADSGNVIQAMMGDRINEAIESINDLEALASCFEGLATLSAEESQLALNQVPLLSVMGTNDPLRKAAENLIGKASNHENLWLEDKDHGTAMIDPLYKQRLREFFDKHSNTTE